MSDESILLEAHALVHGARQQSYGHPSADFSRTALMWQAILGHPVEPHQVAMCLVAVKLSRLVNDPEKRDSWVDIAGYAEAGWLAISYLGSDD